MPWELLIDVVYGLFSYLMNFAFPFRCLEKMADDIDIEAMLEAPYKKVRKMCQ